MFYAKVGESAMVYTGDYNMTPDRHLGAAQIDRLELDLLITEYGHLNMFVQHWYTYKYACIEPLHGTTKQIYVCSLVFC